MVGLTVLEVSLIDRIPDWYFIPGFIMAMFLGMQTFLVMGCLVPAWGVAGLKYIQLRRHAEQYAGWSSAHYPFSEQRIKCAIQAAEMASDRQDRAAAADYAEVGLELSGRSLNHPEMSLSYASCLSFRGSFLENEGRFQEALEDYSRATRLVLPKHASVIMFYAHAAGMLYQLGRFEEAILFARQVTDDRECPVEARVIAYRSAALALAEQGRYTEAAAEGQAGMSVTPLCLERVLLTVDQVWLLTMAGQWEEAAETRALVDAMMKEENLGKWLRPEYSEVQARIEMASEDWANAEALLLAAVQHPGRHAAPYYFLSHLTARRGDAAQAEEWRERLRRECPESFYTQRVRTQKSKEG